MESALTIDRRFRGPSSSGNGGYVAGRLAGQLADQTVAVRLLRPPPLNQLLNIVSDESGCVALVSGSDPVARACPASLALTPAPAPSLQEARQASQRYAGFSHHVFPECFVCGPARDQGDGLRIFAGPLEGRQMVAAPWTPDPSLADRLGKVRPEFIWAALDCPGYFAATLGRQQPAVLGSMTASLDGRLEADQTCIVTGWPISREGRKRMVGTAIYTATGELIAKAEARWIDLHSMDNFR